MSALFTDPYRRCVRCGERAGVWPDGRCPSCGAEQTGAEQARARARALALLREGTEVLRTGGGTELTAPQCNAVLDALSAAEAELREAREVLPALREKVRAKIERRLPHGDKCDLASTSGLCARCDLLASLEVTFGFAYPLDRGAALTRAGEQ